MDLERTGKAKAPTPFVTKNDREHFISSCMILWLEQPINIYNTLKVLTYELPGALPQGPPPGSQSILGCHCMYTSLQY